jgi:hypothetical protein
MVDEKEKIKAEFDSAVKEGKTAIEGSYPVSVSKDLLKFRLGGFPPK